MRKNKILLMPFLALLLLFISNTAFALPTIIFEDDQTFNQNQESTQLRDITITEDNQFSYIKQGEIKITIPDSIKIIFDDERTKENIVIYGTAVTHGKVDEKPAITFENEDKTLVIPVKQDFALEENIVITKVFIEGFNESPSESQHILMKLTGDDEEYISNKYINIFTGSREDTYAPEMPANIQIQDYEGGVKLTWEDPTDLDLSLIEILRGKNLDNVSGNVYQSIAKGIEEYIDKEVVAGDTIKYILRATDGKNSSANTAEVAFVVGSTVIETPEEGTGNDTSDDTTGDQPEETFCTLDYVPVCGVDGTTYTNECTANKEPVEIAHEGECEGTVVDDIAEEGTAQEGNQTDEIEVNFTDIENHWAKENIEKMAKSGIVTGNPDGTFNPNGNLNRAEAAAILYRILKLEEPVAPETKPFSDVIVTEWYAPYISALKGLDLINGNPDGTYKPENEMNRAEFLSLAMNVYVYLANDEEKALIESLKEGEQTKIYIDLKTDWYTELVTAATEKGFLTGSVCGEFKCFNAEDSITRAEATTILYRMFSDYLLS